MQLTELDRVSLHIGMPRAASTTLQRHLFDKHPEITHLWRYIADADAAHVVWQIGRAEPTQYSATSLGETLHDVAVRLHAPGRLLLLSDETFTHTERRVVSAQRLSELFPKADILLIIRSQPDVLGSLFAHLHRDDPAQLNNEMFDQWLRRDMDRRRYLGIYDYATVLDLYEPIYGLDRIHVVPFELLQRNPPAFATNVCRHLGVDPEVGEQLLGTARENVRVTSRNARFERLIRSIPGGSRIRRALPLLLHRASLRALNRGAGVSFQISSAMAGGLLEAYGDGNRRLADTLALPLNEYGYPLR